MKDPDTILDGIPTQLPDEDHAETREWIASINAVIEREGTDRARFLLTRALQAAKAQGVNVPALTSTDYINTIPPELEPEFPGDEETERRIRAFIRWNAAVMVTRAQRPGIGVGGHIATYASAASLYEVGNNWFFRGKDAEDRGDQIFYQGHASPGMYSRAYLEGRIDEERLDLFRQEQSEGGLASYPHPRLMPEFWEFPTVSMGLGPIASIYQARFNRYLHNRGFKDTGNQRVWCFIGDGEMDEPQSQGALTVASREGLDNLTWIVNCNLQRLDGPVRGNGKIIQELEAVFRGAGWNVIKVVWGRKWDKLLSNDHTGALVQKMNETPDGQFQTYAASGGAYIKENFFDSDELQRILAESDLTEEDLPVLDRGGHDYQKVYSAFKMATEHEGQPTVILAHTIKGWTLGPDFEARNATHQMKKLTQSALKKFRDRLQLDISDEELESDLPPYYHPGSESEEMQYLRERREALGGRIPLRVDEYEAVELPGRDAYKSIKTGSGDNEVATTMAFVRLLKDLLKHDDLGPRIVPIIPDEARTFGMDSLFPKQKIYSPVGQRYDPVDREMLLSYKEATDGQILHEGLTEDGAMASFTAVATSYATHGVPMLPIYIFYSMFGFQRTGDLMWQAADQRARGFLLGATAGRTTLNGEGLQHEDGHSILLAATNPAVITYDPSFAFEIAAITEDGINRMYGDDPQDVMYYVTMYNEPTPQPAMPDHVSEEDIVRGLYLFRAAEGEHAHSAQILVSGSASPNAMRAQQMLADEWDVGADLWSAPGWVQLHRDGLAADEYNRLNPSEEPRTAIVTDVLGDASGPFVAVSDYQKAVPLLIAPWVPGRLGVLGTDGFGRSDTRPALRRHFQIDAESIVVAVLSELAAAGDIKPEVVREAIDAYDLAGAESPYPEVAVD
jgi:pyruvate dehydrogenase E1 component